MPYLIDDDIKITESHAIYRYICNKYRPELLGKTIKDKAQVDMVMSVTQDLNNAAFPIAYDSGDKEAMKALAYERMAPISKFLSKKNFIVGDYVTFADFFLFEQLEYFNFACDYELVKKHANLCRYRENMAGLSGLKEYLASDRCIKRPFKGKRAKIT